MIVKLLTEHHLKFLSLKGGCRGSSVSTPVKMSNCWKSHALAHILVIIQKWSNIDPPAKRHSLAFAGGLIVSDDCMLFGRIPILIL